MNIFYIIGVVVVVLFIAGYLGLHVWKFAAPQIRSCPLWVTSGRSHRKTSRPLCPPIATAKADSRKRSCLLCPWKRTFQWDTRGKKP